MNPFAERRKLLVQIQKQKPRKKEFAKKQTPDNLFVQCPTCKSTTTQQTLAQTLYTCPVCDHHYAVTAYHRLKTLADGGRYREMDQNLIGRNLLNFPRYEEKLSTARDSTGLKESVVTALAKIDGIKTVICVMDSRFLMGSMGVVCGEKITRAVEFATRRKLPVVIFCASGGARMQEGIFSLFQMAKTAAAIERHSMEGLLYLSVLTHPTTGGVTASFASLGDIILAEPHALIGFAGPRVIEQTIGQKLPEGFQRSEYLKEHGFVDAVIPRGQLRKTISLLLQMHHGGTI